MNISKDICKEIITNDKTRLIVGLGMFSLGAGLIASVYIKVPQ